MSKSTAEEFIIKARGIHGDKYLYDAVSYIKSSIKVKITCRKHGLFEQTPNSHLNGAGCPSCSGNKKKTTREFVADAIAKHGDSYDYSKVEYRGGHKKVKIICKVHNFEFSQEANSHLNGCGCPVCAREEITASVTKGFNKFKKDAIIIHGNKYHYDCLSYINVTTKMRIKCPEHGWFTKTPDKHLQGQGCPHCSKGGFKLKEKAFVYFLFSGNEIKVGITNNLRRRVCQLKKNTPFDFHVISKIKTIGSDALAIEKYYHKKYESAGLTGFDGATEWLKYSSELMDEIMNKAP